MLEEGEEFDFFKGGWRLKFRVTQLFNLQRLRIIVKFTFLEWTPEIAHQEAIGWGHFVDSLIYPHLLAHEKLKYFYQRDVRARNLDGLFQIIAQLVATCLHYYVKIADVFLDFADHFVVLFLLTHTAARQDVMVHRFSVFVSIRAGGESVANS